MNKIPPLQRSMKFHISQKNPFLALYLPYLYLIANKYDPVRGPCGLLRLREIQWFGILRAADPFRSGTMFPEKNLEIEILGSSDSVFSSDSEYGFEKS